MQEGFREELRESLYLHRPLPLHPERSLESRFPDKRVLVSRPLAGELPPAAGGTAVLISNEAYLTIRAPLRAGCWPEEAAKDGDYANFGTARLDFPLPRQDWRGYNRLRFQVRARIRGARILHLNVGIVNQGTCPVPDPYFREGATVFDLHNGVWTDCIWEFAAMPRDAVSNLCFYVFCSGRDLCAAEELEYDFRDVRLEQVEAPEHERGWVNPAPCINLSSVGYWPDGGPLLAGGRGQRRGGVYRRGGTARKRAGPV